MNFLGVIPARFASSRFPGKPLVELRGVPMIVRVARIASEALGSSNVVVATEDERIRSVVDAAGFDVVMTSKQAMTGTDRLAEVAAQRPALAYVNVQGDEPMLDPENILRVVAAHKLRPDVVHNAMAEIGDNEDVDSVNLPKVVASETGRMLYMSRKALPGFKDATVAPARYWKQVCIYTFARWHLAAFASFGRKSTIEHSEDIEILRFLDLSVHVQMVEVSGGSLAVDTPQDAEKVEQAMIARGMR